MLIRGLFHKHDEWYARNVLYRYNLNLARKDIKLPMPTKCLSKISTCDSKIYIYSILRETPCLYTDQDNVY